MLARRRKRDVVVTPNDKTSVTRYTFEITQFIFSSDSQSPNRMNSLTFIGIHWDTVNDFLTHLTVRGHHSLCLDLVSLPRPFPSLVMDKRLPPALILNPPEEITFEGMNKNYSLLRTSSPKFSGVGRAMVMVGQE